MKNYLQIITAFALLILSNACTKERDSYCASCIGEIAGIIQSQEQQCSDVMSVTETFVADFKADALLKGQSATCAKYIVKDKY